MNTTNRSFTVLVPFFWEREWETNFDRSSQDIKLDESFFSCLLRMGESDYLWFKWPQRGLLVRSLFLCTFSGSWVHRMHRIVFSFQFPTRLWKCSFKRTRGKKRFHAIHILYPVLTLEEPLIILTALIHLIHVGGFDTVTTFPILHRPISLSPPLASSFCRPFSRCFCACSTCIQSIFLDYSYMLQYHLLCIPSPNRAPTMYQYQRKSQPHTWYHAQHTTCKHKL